MTLDDKEDNFLKTQLILAVLPIFVTQLFAFYRIRKLSNGILIEVIILFVDIVIQASVAWPFGVMIVLPISVIIPVYFVRKWTLKFNKTKSLF